MKDSDQILHDLKNRIAIEIIKGKHDFNIDLEPDGNISISDDHKTFKTLKLLKMVDFLISWNTNGVTQENIDRLKIGISRLRTAANRLERHVKSFE